MVCVRACLDVHNLTEELVFIVIVTVIAQVRAGPAHQSTRARRLRVVGARSIWIFKMLVPIRPGVRNWVNGEAFMRNKY